MNALSATGYFFGLTRLPMAEGIALAFIAPLVALFLAAWLLGERVDGVIRPSARGGSAGP